MSAIDKNTTYTWAPTKAGLITTGMIIKIDGKILRVLSNNGLKGSGFKDSSKFKVRIQTSEINTNKEHNYTILLSSLVMTAKNTEVAVVLASPESK